jgi:hypothetical protein
VIDAHTHAMHEFNARVIFVNASALNSNLILLNSTSSRFPNGLGNDNGVLGHYVCHHNYRTGGSGKMAGFEDQYFYGRNPTECILVNFRNLGKQDTDFVGGYTTFTGAYRSQPSRRIAWGAYKDAPEAGTVGDLHAWGDDPQGIEPRPPAPTEKDQWDPAARHVCTTTTTTRR